MTPLPCLFPRLPLSRFCVFPLIFTQMLNYGLIRPSLPTLTLEFFNNSYSRAALVGGLADAAGALLAFCTMPLLGAYSDLSGRRPILIVTLILTSLPIWTLCLYPDYVSLWLFFFVQIPSKLSTYSSVYSYVADTTCPSQRSAAFGQVSAAVFIALTIGPLIASLVTMHVSFMIAGAVSMINVAYTVLLLPESLKLNENRKVEEPLLKENKMTRYVETNESADSLTLLNHDEQVMNTTTVSSVSLTSALSASSPPTIQLHPQPPRLTAFSTLSFMFRTHTYTLLFTMVLLEQLAVYGVGEIFLLYLMRQLQFTRQDNIHFSFFAGIVTCLVMLGLLPLLNRHLGDRKIIILSIVCYVVYSAVYPFISSHWQVYVMVLFSSCAAMSYPATGSLVSRYVPVEEMGMGQGALSGIRSLALGVGPLIFALVFSLSTMDKSRFHYAATPFVLSTLLSAASLAVALKIPKHINQVAQEIIISESQRQSRQHSRRQSFNNNSINIEHPIFNPSNPTQSMQIAADLFHNTAYANTPSSVTTSILHHDNKQLQHPHHNSNTHNSSNSN